MIPGDMDYLYYYCRPTNLNPKASSLFGYQLSGGSVVGFALSIISLVISHFR